MLLVSMIWHIENINIELHIIFALSIPIVFTLWLIIFNSGASKITEFGFSLDEEGLTFIKYGKKERITWENYQGYKLTRSFPKHVEIRNGQGSNISFSFYTFSFEQRNILFEALNNKQR